MRRLRTELTREMLAYSGKGTFVVELIELTRLVTEMAQLLEVTIHRKARLETRGRGGPAALRARSDAGAVSTVAIE